MVRINIYRTLQINKRPVVIQEELIQEIYLNLDKKSFEVC